MDSAWVSLRVTDINDNPPVFTYAQNAQPLHAQTAHPPATVTDPARAHLTLSEDTPTPAHLVTFTAHDIDKVRLENVDKENRRYKRMKMTVNIK